MLISSPQGYVNTISKLIIIDHKRSNYMKTMVDEVMEELTKNAKDYGLEGVIKKLPRRNVLKMVVTKICGNTRNHYREFVCDRFIQSNTHSHETSFVTVFTGN